jgi:hypothetical protein
VRSPDEGVNAVSGVLQYPSDRLTILSQTKGSIFSFWPIEPVISNQSGAASFESIALTKPYQGPGAVVITYRFKALQQGKAVLSFADSQSSILIGDGSGRDVFAASETVMISIVAPRPPENQPEAVQPPIEVLPPVATGTDDSESVKIEDVARNMFINGMQTMVQKFVWHWIVVALLLGILIGRTLRQKQRVSHSCDGATTTVSHHR